MRLALLSRSKPAALINNYADPTTTSAHMMDLGSVNFLQRVEQRYTEHRLKLSNNPLPSPSPHPTNSEDPASHQQQQEQGGSGGDVEAEQPFAIDPDEAGRLRVVSGTEQLDQLLSHVPVTELHGDEEWLEEGDYFKFAQSGGNMDVVMDRQLDITFPDGLDMYVFPTGNISRFPGPRYTLNGLRDYYPMSASSLLPVLLMDIKKDDTVLDMCAAPGGKSLAILQTKLPRELVCNDAQNSRLRRLDSVIKDYLPSDPKLRPTEVFLTKMDGRSIKERSYYDKVLVDVPCFCDRVSLREDENNVFAMARSRERILIPELQMNLLKTAIETVRVGGTVVYSTCTLSPIQNDGVVHMALRRIWEETDIKMVVKDLRSLVAPFFDFMWMSKDIGLKYGQLVMPSISNNYGPLYVAKLVRIG